jgi:hypothetical protein
MTNSPELLHTLCRRCRTEDGDDDHDEWKLGEGVVVAVCHTGVPQVGRKPTRGTWDSEQLEVFALLPVGHRGQEAVPFAAFECR